jgi:pyruvate,water dikinase
MVIEAAHRKHRPVGICGQAPSDYPELAEYLAGLGIDSMSLNPDSLAVVATRLAAGKVAAAEPVADSSGKRMPPLLSGVGA